MVGITLIFTRHLQDSRGYKIPNRLGRERSQKGKMGTSNNWFNVVRRKFHRKSLRDISIRHIRTPSQEAILREVPEEAANYIDNNSSAALTPLSQNKELAKDDTAAIKIQAIFRGHLARRAFRALRSLVKLQALVRGVCVRRQSRLAMHAMHALVRLQVRVRTRQLLSTSGYY